MAAIPEQLKEKFQTLSGRERSIVLLLGLVLVFFVWDQLLFAPLQRQAIEMKNTHEQLTTQLATESIHFSELVKRLDVDPNRELRKRQDQIQQTLQSLDSRYQSLTSELVPPQKMAKVLEDVLKRDTGLALVKVVSLPVRVVSLGAELKADGLPPKNALYQHGFELVLEGTFFEVLDYLKRLEQLSWQILWSKLDYEVIEYPRARVHLQLDTLSVDPQWLEV